MAADLLCALRAASPDADLAITNPAALDAFLSAARGDAVSRRLCLIIDYDLTMSAATTSECHHMLRDAAALPAAFREDVHTLFAAKDEAHPEHQAIFGLPDDADRPHRFWMQYNKLLVEHAITVRMIEDAAAAEKAARGALLRAGVGELLSLCEASGVLVIILSAGIDQVIRAAFAQDGIALHTSCCHLLTNRLVIDEASGRCTAVEPASPPASREGKLLLLRCASLEDALADKDLVLMIGDKPVDARVASGLPPLRSQLRGDDGRGGAAGVRSALSFGFYNTLKEPSMVPSDLDEWRAAFHILAETGNACSFAPLVALLRTILH